MEVRVNNVKLKCHELHIMFWFLTPSGFRSKDWVYWILISLLFSSYSLCNLWMGGRVVCVCLLRTNTSSSSLWLDIDQSSPPCLRPFSLFPGTVRILSSENKQHGNFQSHFLSPPWKHTPHAHIYKLNTFLKTGETEWAGVWWRPLMVARWRCWPLASAESC